MKKHYVTIVSFLVALAGAHQILAEPVLAKRDASTGLGADSLRLSMSSLFTGAGRAGARRSYR